MRICRLAVLLAILPLLPDKASSQLALLPNLIVDGDVLASSLSIISRRFTADDCAVQEGCAGVGKRKLLRFATLAANIGTADLYLGPPADAAGNPNPGFVWSPCHQHYHFSGFARYELLDAGGGTVVTGRKQAFCIEDFQQYVPGSPGPKYDCNNQGISVGWADVYGTHLDCQWLDITGVPKGNYFLRVTVNPDRVLNELSFDDNSGSAPVVIRSR